MCYVLTNTMSEQNTSCIVMVNWCHQGKYQMIVCWISQILHWDNIAYMSMLFSIYIVVNLKFEYLVVL